MPDASGANILAPGLPPDGSMSNGCQQVQAMDRQTAAIIALTDEIRQTRGDLAPAAEAISDLGAAQKRLCAFLVGHRLKLAASVPVVLVTIGGLSPNLAHVLAELLKVWGVK